MTFESELAVILKTTEKAAMTRAAKLKITDTCSRCGGCGAYSFNYQHGSTCYGCGGIGHTTKLPARTSKKKKAALLEAAELAAQDGTLDAYIQKLKDHQFAKNAAAMVMKAWQATKIDSLYSWNAAADGPGRDKDISNINHKMCDAYHTVSLRNFKPSQEDAREVVQAALDAVAAAKVELDEYVLANG